MLEMKTEGGTLRLLYNTDGPVERILIGEAGPGEFDFPPLIRKEPVGLGDAVEEFARLAGVPHGDVRYALTSSQDPEDGREIWPFRITYRCGLAERRPTRKTALLRAAASARTFGPAEVAPDALEI